MPTPVFSDVESQTDGQSSVGGGGLLWPLVASKEAAIRMLRAMESLVFGVIAFLVI
jgi:hypothetical protein